MLLQQFILLCFVASLKAEILCKPELVISGLVKDFCSQHELKLNGNCCVNQTKSSCITVAISLNHLNTAVTNDLFTNQRCFPLPFVQMVDLSDYSGNITDRAFKGFTSLQDIYVPVESQKCPSGISGQPWLYSETLTNSTVLHCYNLTNSCQLSNFSCPQFSICTNNGPGMYNCSCLPNRYGYKCLREGQFPYALFFSVLVATTVVLSTFLWFTQRRVIVKPIKITPM